jgi:hypothetical protein
VRVYSDDVEDRIRVQRLTREWTRSGLLDAAQGERFAAELRVELRRTNLFLRAGLALFTGLIIGASVALLTTVLDLRGHVGTAWISGIAALACIGAAEYLVLKFRCYRFGIEEALAVGAIVLLGISAGETTSWFHSEIQGLPVAVALGVGVAGGLGLYRRFGFVYAALGSMVCAAAIPFQLDLSAASQRALAAAVIACAFVVARSKRLKYADEYPGDEYGHLQAAAWAGMYVVLNIQLTPGWSHVERWFYWCTYVATWVLPLTGLHLGIREKDRELMDVSLVLTLVTILTNSAYLGRSTRPWDPCVLGIALIGVASLVRSWMSAGPGGERKGFMSARLLDKDRALLSHVSTASVLAQPGVAQARAEPQAPPPEFSGGRSGGGGASGGY